MHLVPHQPLCNTGPCCVKLHVHLAVLALLDFMKWPHIGTRRAWSDPWVGPTCIAFRLLPCRNMEASRRYWPQMQLARGLKLTFICSCFAVLPCKLLPIATPSCKQQPIQHSLPTTRPAREAPTVDKERSYVGEVLLCAIMHLMIPWKGTSWPQACGLPASDFGAFCCQASTPPLGPEKRIMYTCLKNTTAILRCALRLS